MRKDNLTMRLFDINGTDYTTFIQAPTYKVNAMEVYEEWTDGNKVNHREVVRQRVQGTFTMIFDNQVDYLAFMQVIDAYKVIGDGSVLGTFYLNNKNTTIQTKVYFNIEPANTLPFLGVKSCEGVQVTIEER